MAPRKLYSRSSIRKIIKAHTNRPLSKNADILIFLDYMLFMEDLIRTSSLAATTRKEAGLTARAIRDATETSLDRFKC